MVLFWRAPNKTWRRGERDEVHPAFAEKIAGRPGKLENQTQ
jgi:hypothetical protein